MKRFLVILTALPLLNLGCSPSFELVPELQGEVAAPAAQVLPEISSLQGTWEQSKVLGADGKSVESNKELFKNSVPTKNNTFMYVEVKDSKITLHLFEANNGEVGYYFSTSDFELKEGVIQTLDTESSSTVDFQISSLTETEITLKPLGEGDPISFVLKKVSAETLKQTLSEFNLKADQDEVTPEVTPTPSAEETPGEPEQVTDLN